MTAAPFNRRAIQDALHAFAVTSMELAEDKVFWTDQEPPQPKHPYATLQLRDLERLGGADEIRIDASGADVEITTGGLRILTLSVNAYTRSKDPDTDAATLIDRFQAALGQVDSELATDLRAAGIAIVDEGNPVNLPQSESDRLVQRCALDVRICIAANVTEHVDYFETAEITSPALGWDPLVLELSPEE